MAKEKEEKKTFPVLDMSCAACATRVDKTLNKQNGVHEASVNFATSTATVVYDAQITNPEQLRKAVQDAGYDLLIDNTEEITKQAEEAQHKRYQTLKTKVICAILLSIPIVAIGMIFMHIPYANEIMWILSTPVVFWIGKDFFVNAWKQLKHRTSNMDTLVALSTSIAYMFSVFNVLFPNFWLSHGVHPHVYFEAASVIITFVLLGRLLEEKAKGNTSSAIKKLLGLQPKTVVIVKDNGEQQEVAISEVRKDQTILVKPGDKIPVDGIVVDGSSYVNESMLSGEPVPILKEKDAKVYAGTINLKGSFQFKAQKVGADTMLSQIIRMVQDAQGSKAPVQKTVDKIASVFVPVIITLSLLSLVAWLIFAPVDGLTHGLLAMITVLVIACPCALGLATPTAIMVGIGKGAEKGILIKDAESLELAKNVNAIVLDKTGTITEGKPEVTDISWEDETTKDSDISIFYSLEKLSEHPLADAVVKCFGTMHGLKLDSFESITGKGIKGVVNQKMYYAGNEKLLKENDVIISDKLGAIAIQLAEQSKSVIWFADDTRALAVVGITDQIKQTSISAIQQLQSQNIDVYMLTGDGEAAAAIVAATAGIKYYKAGVLPQDKAEFIQQLQKQGKVTAMVGDGINDSAALAQADLSIAMGTGSDIAIDTAKMTIISSDLTKIPVAIKLSKLTVQTIKQNLFWAFIYNLIGIPIAAGILYPINGFLLSPMIAGAAMALSSVSVVTNSLSPNSAKFPVFL